MIHGNQRIHPQPDQDPGTVQAVIGVVSQVSLYHVSELLQNRAMRANQRFRHRCVTLVDVKEIGQYFLEIQAIHDALLRVQEHRHNQVEDEEDGLVLLLGFQEKELFETFGAYQGDQMAPRGQQQGHEAVQRLLVLDA